MTTHQLSRAVVARLDLRSDAPRLVSQAALRALVAGQLAPQGLAEPDDQRFLVVDTPAGLTAHQEQYELISGYRTVGEVRVLCLLVGGLPAAEPGAADPYPAERRLVRPAVLRSSTTSLLWVGDLRSARVADRQAPVDDPHALAVLVDLLLVPELFDEVLDALAPMPDGVAAPAVRLLEQDLAEEVRDRAWREALLRFAGEDADGTTGGTVTAADLPKHLADLLTGRPGGIQHHRLPGGPADRAYRACAEALAEAEDEAAVLAGWRGLLGPAARRAFETALEHARATLDEYRQLAERVLRSETGPAAGRSAADGHGRLAQLGLRVPPSDGAGERVGEGLRQYAERLLGEGLALRSVAQRFVYLAGRVEPVPNTVLLPRLARYSREAVAERAVPSAQGAPFPPVPGRRTALTVLAGVLGGLWSWPTTPLALLVPLLLLGAALLGAARLAEPGAGPRAGLGPRGRWQAARSGVAALAGGVAGALAGAAWAAPMWLGVVALVAGFGIAEGVALANWRDQAGEWSRSRGTDAVQDALNGLDALLAEAVSEHWAAEERLYCADAARSVATVLRATAAAAETEAATGQAVADGPRLPSTASPVAPDPAAPGDEEWLLAQTPLGGPEFTDVTDPDEDADWTARYAWESQPGADEGQAPEPAPTPGAVQDPAPGAGQGPAPGAPRWLDREAGEGGPDLVATLAGDLTDAAMTALGPYWGAVDRGQAGATALPRIEERVRELLSVARNHLRRNGVVPAPPYAAAHRTRSGSANLLGIGSQRIAEAAGPNADRQAVVQLSSAEQSTLLNRDPSAVSWLRFAPQAVRGEIERAATGSEPTAPEATAVWTTSGRYVGLLRLTPLRVGVVHTVRPRQPDEDPGYGVQTGGNPW